MFSRQSLVFGILELTAIIEISCYRITYTDKRKSAGGWMRRQALELMQKLTAERWRRNRFRGGRI